MKKNKAYLLILITCFLIITGCIGPGSTPKTFRVQGIVQNEDGQPLSGIKVLVVYDGDSNSYETAADGKFIFDDLKGRAEIAVEADNELRFLPSKITVIKESEDLSFTGYLPRTYGEETTIPENRQLVFQDLHLDFSASDLSSGERVTVSQSERAALGEMTGAGPVLDIVLPAELRGPVSVSFTTTHPDAWIFHYLEAEEEWEPVLTAEYEQGELRADLSDFSTYGIFTAPRAPQARVNPEPGRYRLGLEIALEGDKIYYTTDGSTPGRGSSIYRTPILFITDSLKIRAINTKPNCRPSEPAEFTYTKEATDEEFVARPRFATLRGKEGRYFNFATGETTSEGANTDLWLTVARLGNEYTDTFSFHSTNVIRYRAESGEPETYLNDVLTLFRSLGEEDWNEAEAKSNVSKLQVYDILLIKTHQDRLVKVLITQKRRAWQDVDAELGLDIPELDFVYLFLGQVDIEPPRLESITVKQADGFQVNVPVPGTGGIIEIDLPGKPDLMHLHFDEMVYRNRPLKVTYPQMREVTEYYGMYTSYWEGHGRMSAYYGYRHFSDEFIGAARYGRYSATTEVNYVEITGGDQEFITYMQEEFNFGEDQGFYFSDIMGNKMTEMPFEKLIIRYVDPE